MDYSNEPHGVYFFIDNKSFYASCESVERKLNPLKSILVVMSQQANTGGGLVLASSPRAKELFGISNVTRQYDLPKDKRLLIVPPRMNLYIKRNLQINQIFDEFAAEKDILPYSIDESLIDMTHSWKLFGKSVREVARKIQLTVRNRLGLYTTVGIGDNPMQAKLALDIYAKHNHELMGEIHYDSVPQKIWSIKHLTDICGIGKHMELRLNSLGIYTVNDIAHANPYLLKDKLGVIGTQIFATAWGIDRSNMKQQLKPQERSYSNGQVLPRDYFKQAESEVMIKEMAEQVALRIRFHGLQTSWISLAIGFSFAQKEKSGARGFAHSMKIEATDDGLLIANRLVKMFREYWHGETIRNVMIDYGKLRPKCGNQLNLFVDNKAIIKRNRLNQVKDQIIQKFGTTSLVYADSLESGATAIQRAGLVGGHRGGNSYE